MSGKRLEVHFHGGENACGYYRLLWPALIMGMQGRAQIVSSTRYVLDFAFYSSMDVIRIQRQGTKPQLEFFNKLLSMRDNLKFKLSYDIDDLPFYEDIPIYNYNYEDYNSDELRANIQALMELCDCMTVSTEQMKQYFLEKTKQKNIQVIPNYVPRFWIGSEYSEGHLLHNFEKHRSQPRILYFGSSSHIDSLRKSKNPEDDFQHVKDAIIESRKEFTWVFVGTAPYELAPYCQAGEMEFHPWKNLVEFPRFLSLLDVNMAVAPLADNMFNRCKSNNKYVETSALGLPCACQDMVTYDMAPIRFTDGKSMLQSIRRTLQSKESFIEASRSARKYAEMQWLEREENIAHHHNIFTD